MSATTSTSVSTNLSSDAASINSRADLRSGGRLKRWMHTQKQLFISCFSPDITPIAPRAHLRSKRDTLPSSTSTVRLSRSETCLPTSEIPRICGATDSATSNPASVLHLEIPPSPMSFLTTTSASFDWSNMPHSAVASSDHGRSFSPTDALPARTSSELEGRFQAMMNWQAKQRCAPVELAQSTMAVNECGDDCVDPILPPSPSPLGYKRVPFREVDEQEVDNKTSVGHSTWSASEARARGRLVAWWSNQSLRSHYNGHELSTSTIVYPAVKSTQKVHVPAPLVFASGISSPSTRERRENWQASIYKPARWSHESGQSLPSSSSSECSTSTALFSASSDATATSVESAWPLAQTITGSKSSVNLDYACQSPKSSTVRSGISLDDKARLHRSLLDFANLSLGGLLMDQQSAPYSANTSFSPIPRSLTKRVLVNGTSSLSALMVLAWAERHGTVAHLHTRGQGVFVEWRGEGVSGIEDDISCLSPVQLCPV